MVDFRERRRVHRVPVAGELDARARATLPVRLLDLSPYGARIEHLDLLRPGSACTFDLPPVIGPLTLFARVIHSSIVGAAPTPDGERMLRYHSGLAFTGITTDQQTSLASALERLLPGSEPRGGRLPV
jgi:hypothetical protein